MFNFNSKFMLDLLIVGHLGADAEFKEQNGDKYLQFRVASSRRWKDQSGISHEETTWVSCFLRGRVDNLLPYLRKGQLIYARGYPQFRAYSSEQARGFVAGVSINVDRIELLGSSKNQSEQQVTPTPPQSEQNTQTTNENIEPF